MNGIHQFLPSGAVRVIFATLLLGSLGFATHVSAAELTLTDVSTIRSNAVTDNTFENGWKWEFKVTLPENETEVQMKFSDWTFGEDSRIPAATNARYYSAQSTDVNDAEHAVFITVAHEYGESITIDPTLDLDPTTDGIQIIITAETRVPTGAAVGSFITQYGIQSLAPAPPPDEDPGTNGEPLALSLASTSAAMTYNSVTPTQSYGTFTIKYNVTAGDEDIFIPNTSGADMEGAVYTVNYAPGIFGSNVSSIVSTADLQEDFFVVRAGTTKSFTLTVVLDPQFTGIYTVRLAGINYYVAESTDEDPTLFETDSDEFATDALYIPSGVTSN